MGCGNEGDIHTVNFSHFVDVDFGEDNLFGDTEGVVASAVETLVADTAEVT